MSIEIGKTVSGIDYRFELHGNHLVVDERAPSELSPYHKTWQRSTSWYEKLTESERLQVFREVLAEYRERSIASGDFKLAALGITESGSIYIGTNSDQLSDDFHRQCAEQSMVTIAGDREAYAQRKKNSEIKRTYPRFRDVYLMGGQPPQIQVACPCGNCTDLLAKYMNRDANVWILPVETPGMTADALRINDTVDAAEKLGKGEAWKTTIGHLNKDRVITLSDEAAHAQRKAYDWIFDGVDEFVNERAPRTLEGPFTDADLVEEMYQRIAITFVDHLDELARMAGHDGGIRHLDTEQLKELAMQHIRWVRCAAIQRTDGEWAIETSGKSPALKSLPSPETVALVVLGDRLASHGIRRVEVMECAPWHIRDGTMRTSPKAAIEREVKNSSKEGEDLTMRFHGLSAKPTPGLQFDYSPRQIFPSYFTGKTPLRLDDRVAAEKVPASPPRNHIAQGVSEGGLADGRAPSGDLGK